MEVIMQNASLAAGMAELARKGRKTLNRMEILLPMCPS